MHSSWRPQWLKSITYTFVICHLWTKPGSIASSGMFDMLHATGFPTTHPTMSVAMRVLGQPGEALTLTFQLGRPNGDVVLTAPLNVAIASDGGCNINVTLNQTQFSEPGRYTLKVLLGKEVLASRSIRLVLLGAAPQLEQPTSPAPNEKSRLH